MNTYIPDQAAPVSIDKILCRDDTWRGEGHPTSAPKVIESSYPALDAALVGGGWPVGGLIEVCQAGWTRQEWLLLQPALQHAGGLIVLLNPPLIPFTQGLLVLGVPVDRVRVVLAPERSDFISCFVEIARTSACGALLSWQPAHNLSYTELRKCALAASEGSGLYTLFRPAGAQQQSSPANLRLLANTRSQELSVTIFKQRGTLQRDIEILLSLPDDYMPSLPYHLLDLYELEGGRLRSKPKAPVVPLRQGAK